MVPLAVFTAAAVSTRPLRSTIGQEKNKTTAQADSHTKKISPAFSTLCFSLYCRPRFRRFKTVIKKLRHK